MYINALKLCISLPLSHFFVSMSCYQINPCLLRRVGDRWSGRINFSNMSLEFVIMLDICFWQNILLILTSSSFRVWRNFCSLSAVFSAARDKIFWSIVAHIKKLERENVRAGWNFQKETSLIFFPFSTC